MVITLLSDFGDVYPASMKGVILSIDPGANIVDISHSIPRHDIRAGAFILMTSARYFPSGTVHIAVVDPGVGTKRRPLAIRTESPGSHIHYFIGPDNGLLIPAAKSIGEFEVFEITNDALFLEKVSSTFHGRDIFAPVGAHISKGIDIARAGSRIYDFVGLDFGEGKKNNNSIQGEIIFIDTFGNIITNISSDIIDFKYGDTLNVQGIKIPFVKSYGSVEEGGILALIGSHGYLEIAVNMGSAAAFLKIKEGDKVQVDMQ
jgi:S-adenosylmethionine hydrolase